MTSSQPFLTMLLLPPWYGLLIVLLACCFIERLPVAAAEAPNIILLMGDDHGWEETGYNGHAHLQTPVLDEMASSGLRLDRFYAAHPSCSPTRGSVMTGRHPNRYGTFAPNWSIRPEEITIAHRLRDAGYVTGHFGKWHLGPVKAASPTCPGAMGFDAWLSHDNFFELNPQLSRNGGEPKKFSGESSQVLIDETVSFIEQARRNEKPFFAVVWFGSPHEPYSGLEADLALYDDLPAAYSERIVKLTSNETGAPTRRPLRDVLRERYAEITAMDRAIGKLRESLAAMGARENTLLWYCGDNGTPPSGLAESPLRGLKGQMYEGGIRVPGLMEWPRRIQKPRTSQVNAVTSDMLPTICGLAGASTPDRPLDGIDLRPLIDGEMTQRPSPIHFWAYNTTTESKREPWIEPALQQGTTPLVKLMAGKPTRTFQNVRHETISDRDFTGTMVILDNRFKLIVHSDDSGTSKELFDLRSDSAEQSNRIDGEAAVASALETQLEQWQRSVLHSLTGADYQ